MELATGNPAWRKSTHSGNGVNCVEMGAVPGSVLIRDTKDKGTGPVIAVSPDEFRRFAAAVRRGVAVHA